MLRPIKIAASPDNVFAVSDTHFGHDKPFIYEPRGFKSVQEHDETLISRWNETVPPDGVVIHCGDFCIQKDEAGFWEIVRRLNFGTLFALQGNHNSGLKAAYQAVLQAQYPDAAIRGAEVYPLETCVDGDPARKVVFLPEYVEMSVAKTRIVACHYPILSHHKMSAGSYHICGHSHSNLPLTNPKTGVGRRLDVGIESFGRPISLTEVFRILKNRETDSRDHHKTEES